MWEGFKGGCGGTWWEIDEGGEDGRMGSEIAEWSEEWSQLGSRRVCQEGEAPTRHSLPLYTVTTQGYP